MNRVSVCIVTESSSEPMDKKRIQCPPTSIKNSAISKQNTSEKFWVWTPGKRKEAIMSDQKKKENPKGHRNNQTRQRNASRKEWREAYLEQTGTPYRGQLKRWPLPDLPKND
ncbi:hypothetical protein LCGC14_0143310 [marine sediment metagenome]|uniref:Uncharacterized protein n=1 Tax=marine sediment metagenome TaxID=412755 RepID=A0A0F9VGV9_9ZZZZ